MRELTQATVITLFLLIITTGSLFFFTEYNYAMQLWLNGRYVWPIIFFTSYMYVRNDVS